MTTLTSSSNLATETALQKEQKLFRELLPLLRDALLNRLFDLRPEKAARRLRYLALLFLASGFLVSLAYYPWWEWALRAQDVFSYLFIQTSYIPNFPGDPFANIASYGVDALTDPRTLQYLPILLASFFIALQSAAIYLADIFELEDVRVARSFVSEVALTGSDETIRITQGDIFEGHRSSSNYLIGGPGKVVVDMDSAALFEKPDGTHRIIGPTSKEPAGKATLTGFERFRQAIDLRDHYIELRDQDVKSPAVKSRSRDGITITATDVRFMFSVNRDGKKPTTETPYPFSQKAIENLVYKATSRVTPDLTNPSTFEFSWIINMTSLIRGKLGGFMYEHNLTAYLASIGMPEFERAKSEEEKIAEQTRTLASNTSDDLPRSREIKPPPEFLPREKVKSLFAQFTDEFMKTTRERGVDLHWIGVGTWKTPIESVSEKHREAWKISRENAAKGSEAALRGVVNEAIIQEMITLIQDVPIDSHQTATEKFKDERSKAKRDILKSYQQQLIKTRDFIDAKANPTPEEKASAVIVQKAINNIIKAYGHGP